MTAAWTYSIVPFSGTPVFNANQASTFQIAMSGGNVTAPTIFGGVAGQMLTFVLVQDALGGRTFSWPSNVKNASDPNPLANSRSIQSFIFDGVNAYPINPMTYN